MCGICGFTGAAPTGSIDAMLARLRHRGPDDEGRFSSAHATLGARRLAVIDVADGHQPTANEDESVHAVFNGEIYNHRSLRRMLAERGHQFRSGTDTEILPHLFEEFGPAFVGLLRGMFAVAVWDARTETLLLARDRAGEKPLFYTPIPGGLAFASEMRSLLANPRVGRTIDAGTVAAYLTLGYVPGPRTPIAEVRRLPPAHTLLANGGEVRISAYWEPMPSAPQYAVSRDGAPRQLRCLLEAAVREQIEADVPVGALLSGGIDSAAIVALMAQVGSHRPRTFTVGFAESDFDERAAAAAVASHVGSDHTEVVVGQPDAEELRTLVSALDEPIGDQAALPTLLIAREARRHVTVVLTGEGSDELFAGYPRYRWFDAATRLAALPAVLRSTVSSATGQLAPAARQRQLDLLLAPRGWLERYLDWIGIFSAADVAGIVRPELLSGDGRLDAPAHLGALAERWPGASPVERTMLLDLSTWLADDLLVKADRMSMAVALEARAPYLDHRVIQFATSLPPAMRIGRRGTKWLLREAVADLLPEQTLRRRKQAFRVPVDIWLGQRLAPVMRELLMASDARTDQFLRPSARDRVLARAGREAGRQVWALGILELWLRSLEEAL